MEKKELFEKNDTLMAEMALVLEKIFTQMQDEVDMDQWLEDNHPDLDKDNLDEKIDEVTDGAMKEFARWVKSTDFIMEMIEWQKAHADFFIEYWNLLKTLPTEEIKDYYLEITFPKILETMKPMVIQNIRDGVQAEDFLSSH